MLKNWKWIRVYKYESEDSRFLSCHSNIMEHVECQVVGWRVLSLTPENFSDNTSDKDVTHQQFVFCNISISDQLKAFPDHKDIHSTD